jgi:hypothetical protein
MSDFKMVWTQILGLSDNERAEIAKRLAGLGYSSSGSSSVPVHAKAGWLYKGYEAVFWSRKAIRLKTTDFQGYTRVGGSEMEERLEVVVGKQFSETAKLWYGRLAARLHIRVLEVRADRHRSIDRGMGSVPPQPVTPTWCWSTLKELPSIIDDAYPGYMANGALGAVIQAAMRKEK